MKIAFAQATFNRDIELTKTCIQRISPFVDVSIISYDQSVTNSDLKWFEDNKEKYKLELVKYEWRDNMPAMRNSYLQRAKELKVRWLVVSDPDELFDENLAKNIRTLIDKYDTEGYSILGVSVKDQFQPIGNTDWFDNVDKIKEWPAGYQETDYFKPMLIYKIFPDIIYEGIGIEKKVHETLITQYKQRTINLPKEFFYVHTKSAIDIWRNAARNMFLSGGGDNVGSKNRLWVELRQLCSHIGINSWNDFEEFVKLGYDRWSLKIEDESVGIDINLINGKWKNEFRLWLEAALKALPTKEGTETRETAKWYYSLHTDELDQIILDLIKTVPMTSQELEVENFVTQTYYQILGRHPDRTGLNIYVQKIINKELKRHEILHILMNSPEYKKRSLHINDIEKSTKKSFQLSSLSSSPSSSQLSSFYSDYKTELTDEEILKYDKIQQFIKKMYNRVLGRTIDIPVLDYYTEEVMRKQIKLVDLPNIFKNSEEYLDLHANRRGIGNNIGISIKSKSNDTIDNISQPNKQELKMINIGKKESRNTVALCIMGTRSELPFMIESINTTKEVVDEIHVQTDDFIEKDINELKNIDERVKVHFEKWEDNFSDYKNKCYGHATTEWVLICDADEIPTVDMSHRLKEIILKSDNGNNFDMVSFDVIDITTVDIKVIYKNRTKGGKALLHWNIPSIYVGPVHIHIKDGYYPFKSIHAPVAYKHIKEKDSILEKSARNVWMGGGGDTVEDKNPLWRKLRDISKELGFERWHDFKEYCKKGNIDIRILDIFKEMCNLTWKDEELHDLLRWYVKLHPEETIK